MCYSTTMSSTTTTRVCRAVSVVSCLLLLHVCVAVNVVADNQQHNNNQQHAAEQLWPLEMKRAFSLSESAPVGMKIFLDAIVNENYTYTIIEDVALYHFRIVYVDSNLALELHNKLDRETFSELNLTIAATLHHLPPNHTASSVSENVSIQCIITDTNDNPPIFEYSYYSVSLNESVGAAVTILQVNANDADEAGNPNSDIQYSIEPNQCNDRFAIDAQTGVITTALDGPLDFGSQKKVCVFTVSARDLGSPSQSSYAYVTVYIVEERKLFIDPRPIITNQNELSRVEVYENNQVGQVIAEVHAQDFNAQPNAQITFELEPVGDHDNFSISARTGQIQALVSFDFEEQAEYSLQVTAINNQNGMRRSTNVKVQIIDINEELAARFDPMSIGIVVVIVFFAVLVVVITTSFIAFQCQKKKKKNDMRGAFNTNHSHRKISTLPFTLPIKQFHAPLNGQSPQSTLMHVHPPLRDQNSLTSQHHPPPPVPNAPPHQQQSQHQQHHQQQHQQLHQQQHPMKHAPPPGRPDVIDAPNGQLHGHGHGHSQMHQHQRPKPPPSAMQRADPPAPPSHSFSLLTGPSDYSELVATEHYDLENASSIAPSDLDGLAIYHYKGFPRDSSGQTGQHRHVPLARLSPSVSELTSPRILTLHDLSPGGPPCPAPQASRSKAGRPPAVPVDSSDDANSVESFTSSEADGSRGEQRYHYLSMK